MNVGAVNKKPGSDTITYSTESIKLVTILPFYHKSDLHHKPIYIKLLIIHAKKYKFPNGFVEK